jgi:hypothetical protein
MPDIKALELKLEGIGDNLEPGSSVRRQVRTLKRQVSDPEGCARCRCEAAQQTGISESL